MKLTANTHFSEILPLLRQKRDAIALDLQELRNEGVNVIDVDPGDLLLLERCGYMIDVVTGRVMAGPKVLVL